MTLIMSIIAAFGGGMFGALIGGTTAFIFTGITGLIGVAIQLSSGSDMFLTNVTFGPFFGPHVGFVGGVAGVAFLNWKKKRLSIKLDNNKVNGIVDVALEEEVKLLEPVSGTNALDQLFKYKDTSTLLVAGMFSTCGFLLNYVFSSKLALPLDTVALTIVVMNIISRLVFDSSGLLGKSKSNETRYGVVHKNLIFNMVWAFGLSLVVSYVTLAINHNAIGFFISGVSLIFVSMGRSLPGTHHITLVTAYASLAFNNMFVGALFGLVALVIGEYIERTLNLEVESIVDMPSTVIALLSLIIMGIF